MEKGANISKCGKYRYSLWRIWDKEKEIFTFICLNPSTADNVDNDATVRKCIRLVKKWGGGGFYIANLFAYRSTKPADLYTQEDPIGPENDNYINLLSHKSAKVIAGWGNNGTYLKRSEHVKSLLKGKLYYLILNKTNEPRHPLPIKETELPKLF